MLDTTILLVSGMNGTKAPATLRAILRPADVHGSAWSCRSAGSLLPCSFRHRVRRPSRLRMQARPAGPVGESFALDVEPGTGFGWVFAVSLRLFSRCCLVLANRGPWSQAGIVFSIAPGNSSSSFGEFSPIGGPALRRGSTQRSIKKKQLTCFVAQSHSPGLSRYSVVQALVVLPRITDTRDSHAFMSSRGWFSALLLLLQAYIVPCELADHEGVDGHLRVVRSLGFFLQSRGARRRRLCRIVYLELSLPEAVRATRFGGLRCD